MTELRHRKASGRGFALGGRIQGYGANKVKKRIVVAVGLSVLLAASVYAQTTDFFELVKTGTSQQVQAAIDKGADVNALTTIGGNTPLMLAAGYNQDPEVITVLLSHDSANPGPPGLGSAGRQRRARRQRIALLVQRARYRAFLPQSAGGSYRAVGRGRG